MMLPSLLNVPGLLSIVFMAFFILWISWISKGSGQSIAKYAQGSRRIGPGGLATNLSLIMLSLQYATQHLFRGYGHDWLFSFAQLSGQLAGLLFLQIFLSPRHAYFQQSVTGADMIGQMYGKRTKRFTATIGVLLSLLVTALLLSNHSSKNSFFTATTYGLGLIIGIACLCAYWGGLRSIAVCNTWLFFLFLGFTSLIIHSFFHIRLTKVTGLSLLEKCLKWTKKHELSTCQKVLPCSPWLVVPSIFIFSFVSLSLVAAPLLQTLLATKHRRELKRIFISSYIFYPLAWLSFLLLDQILLPFSATPNGYTKENMLKVLEQKFSINTLIEWNNLVQACLLLAFLANTFHSMAVLIKYNIIPRRYDHRPFTAIERRQRTLRTKRITLCLGAGLLLSSKMIYFIQEHLTQQAWPLLLCGLLIAPFILGIIGLESSSKTFFLSIKVYFLSFFVFFLFSYFTGYTSLTTAPSLWCTWGVILSIILACVAFLYDHWKKNKRFERKEEQTISPSFHTQKMFFWKEIFACPKAFAQTILEGQPSLPFFFGISYPFFMLLSHWCMLFTSSIAQNIYYILQLINLLGCLIILNFFWFHEKWKRYKAFLWLSTLCICLSFSPFLILLLEPTSPLLCFIWLSALLLLTILLDWHGFFLIGVIGHLFALAAYSLLRLFFSLSPFSFSILKEYDSYFYIFLFYFFILILSILFIYQKSVQNKKLFYEARVLSSGFLHDLYLHLENIPDHSLHNLLSKILSKPENKSSKGVFVDLLDFKELVVQSANIEREMNQARNDLLHFRSCILPNTLPDEAFKWWDIRNLINMCWQKLSLENQKRVLLPPESHDFNIKVYFSLFSYAFVALIENAFLHGESKEVKIDWNYDSRTLFFIDNGCGIPAEKQKDIFQYTYDPTRKEIGLPFIEMIFEQVKANITFSTSSKGTTFAIKFPKESAFLSE